MPTTIDYGREVYVKFKRGAHEVSISMEHGSCPIIEIFYPATGTGLEATPWAEEDGIPRTRRFPRISNEAKCRQGEDLADNCIQRMAVEFEMVEVEWLTA